MHGIVPSASASTGNAAVRPDATAGSSSPSFHVAPMREYTDRHMRALLRRFSRRAVLWGEMEKTQAVLQAGELFADGQDGRLANRARLAGSHVS